MPNVVHMFRTGSFILVRKRHRFQMGLLRIQFNIHIGQRQRSKKSIRFPVCFNLQQMNPKQNKKRLILMKIKWVLLGAHNSFA